MMLSYFKSCQLKNLGFFYAFQMDVEGRLANCFWIDSRSKMAYKYFGDVVTFDSTYLTNKYKMSFVPFTGVNHHQQSILFSCALLWDETIESFFWLLSTWLEAMSGISSKTIITDQDVAISNAVAKVFPKVNHHYCMWYIEKKVPEYLNRGILEMVRKGSSTCSYCMKRGHTKPKCPNLNQTMYFKITCTCLLIFLSC